MFPNTGNGAPGGFRHKIHGSLFFFHEQVGAEAPIAVQMTE
jgi:hypothetical protein